jgi:uncharacterized protein YjiK
MSVFLEWLLAIALLSLSACSPQVDSGEITAHPASPPELELIAAWNLNTPQLLEPSGLVLSRGQLYTVADKVDNRVFRIDFSGEAPRLRRDRTFTPPEAGTLDWEGITADPEGNLYLISERKGRVMELTPAGEARWITPDLREAGSAMGLFRKRNAGFEGITWLGPGHWLAAAERETRGLVEFQRSADEWKVEAFPSTDSPYVASMPLFRTLDYSALSYDVENKRLFVLFRAAHLLVALKRSPQGNWVETEAWSYRHIERDPRWAFLSQTYGQAEGLVVSGSEIFIIFDNNLGGRMSDRNDRRPLLVKARFPGLDLSP